MILVAAAQAAPASLDVELFRPSVGPDVVTGVASPGWDQPTLAVALVSHYSHDPLVLDREIGVVSSVVRSRVTLDVLAAWQPNSWLGFELEAPMMGEWGSETPSDAADRFGNGDLRVAARAGPLVRGPLRGAVRLDLAVPIGIREAWMGEENFRATPLAVADLDLGRIDLAADLGVTIRALEVETTAGLSVGPELRGDLGVGVALWPEHARMSLALASRNGLGADPGNHAAELLAALEVRPIRPLRTTFFVGRGVTAGYGAPDLRLGFALQYTPRETDAPAPTTMTIDADDDFVDHDEPKPGWTDPDDPSLVPQQETVVAETAPARVVSDEIVILRPIQFERGTARILPESLPTVAAVAGVLNSEATIVHLVIEGHASEEGDYAYNYELSMSRASAVYRELVNAGVYPERLSCRSVGEVDARGDAAANRRVVFRITERLAPGATPPVYPSEIVAPWSGARVPIITPPPPPPPPPAPAAPSPDLLEDA